MSFTPEFKKEFVKALKLSAFITVLLIGVLSFGAHQLLEQPQRGIASDPSNREGVSESTSRRAVPPFVRSEQ